MNFRACVTLLVCSTASAASAATYQNKLDGYRLEIPAGWKHQEQGGRLLMGSDREAGLIAAWWVPNAGLAEIEQHARRGIVEGNLALMPRGEPKSLKVPAGRALSVELGATGSDGVPIRALAVGIVGASGSLAIVGLTNDANYAEMSARVLSMARAVKFFAPDRSAGADGLRGPMCAHIGGSGYSGSSRMVFDGQGQVGIGSEFIASGSFKNAEGGYAGDYGVTSGNQHQAANVGRYRVEGGRVAIRWPNGNVLGCDVFRRQTSGQITELKCNGKLYAGALCE